MNRGVALYFFRRLAFFFAAFFLGGGGALKESRTRSSHGPVSFNRSGSGPRRRGWGSDGLGVSCAMGAVYRPYAMTRRSPSRSVATEYSLFDEIPHPASCHAEYSAYSPAAQASAGSPPMTAAGELKKMTPPYTSYVTFKNKIRELAAHGSVPARVDPSLLDGMSGTAQAQFLYALRYFALIDDKGTPSDELRLLAQANDTDWKRCLTTLLHAAYKTQIPIMANGSPKQLRESFGPEVAPSVVSKCVRFLVNAALDAGIPVSGPIAKTKGGGVGGTRTRNKKTKPANGGREVPQPTETPAARHNNGAGAGEDPILAKFPAFDPAWSPEIQTKWFDAFEKLMKLKGGGL